METFSISSNKLRKRSEVGPVASSSSMTIVIVIAIVEFVNTIAIVEFEFV